MSSLLDSVGTSQIANLAVEPSKLNITKTTDANGWTVRDFGSFKQYTKRFIWTGSQNVAVGSLFVAGTVSLPVGKNTSNLIINYTGRANDRIFYINTRIYSDSEPNVTIEVNNYHTSSVTLTKAWVDFICVDV